MKRSKPGAIRRTPGTPSTCASAARDFDRSGRFGFANLFTPTEWEPYCSELARDVHVVATLARGGAGDVVDAAAAARVGAAADADDDDRAAAAEARQAARRDAALAREQRLRSGMQRAVSEAVRVVLGWPPGALHALSSVELRMLFLQLDLSLIHI